MKNMKKYNVMLMHRLEFVKRLLIRYNDINN